jgi:putative transcription antitermination factor YqgF
MKYLGIDYGKKKIGLSLSEGSLASPYKTIIVSSLADAVGQIAAIIRKESIEKLVIGQPESGESLTLVKKFITLIKPHSELVLVPETLSSSRAQALSIELGQSQSARKKDDALAATFLLQDYLDSHE